MGAESRAGRQTQNSAPAHLKLLDMMSGNFMSRWRGCYGNQASVSAQTYGAFCAGSGVLRHLPMGGCQMGDALHGRVAVVQSDGAGQT